MARAGQALTALGATVVQLPAGIAPTRLGVTAARHDVAGAAAALLVAGLIDLGHRARLVEPAQPTEPGAAGARGLTAASGPSAVVEAAAEA